MRVMVREAVWQQVSCSSSFKHALLSVPSPGSLLLIRWSTVNRRPPHHPPSSPPPLEAPPTTLKSPNPTCQHLPNSLRQLQLAPLLPHGGPKARPLTAIGCPGLYGACAPLAPPASPAPGEREGLRWCQHRRGPLGLLPAPGDAGGGRCGGRGAGARSGKRSGRRGRKGSNRDSFISWSGRDDFIFLLVTPVAGRARGGDGDDALGSGQRHLPGCEWEQSRDPAAAAVWAAGHNTTAGRQTYCYIPKDCKRETVNIAKIGTKWS